MVHEEIIDARVHLKPVCGQLAEHAVAVDDLQHAFAVGFGNFVQRGRRNRRFAGRLGRRRSLYDLDPFFHHRTGRAVRRLSGRRVALSLRLGVNFRVLRIIEDPRNAEHVAEAATAAPLDRQPKLAAQMGPRSEE